MSSSGFLDGAKNLTSKEENYFNGKVSDAGGPGNQISL